MIRKKQKRKKFKKTKHNETDSFCLIHLCVYVSNVHMGIAHIKKMFK